MYALLTLLAEPEDRVALRCWCGFGSDGLGEAGWRRIRARCEQTGDSPRDVLEQLAQGHITVPHTGPVVQRYALFRQQETAMAPLRGHELADALFPKGQEWAEPLRTIVASSFPAATDFEARELLQEIRAGVTQMETPTDVDFVRVMSLHKSKGLTAKLVVVMGCIEGMIPRIDYSAPLVERQRSLEEQRRLFYVALTRTTETLVLSSVTHIPTQQAFQMGLGVAGGQVQASRFITELGPTHPAPTRGEALI